MTTQDEDLRDTLPPTAETEPPPAFNPPPSEALKRMHGYDDNQFLHVALAAAADAAHEIRESRKTQDIELLLEKQTARILKETSADYDSLRSSITGLQKSVDALVTRIGNTETALDAGEKHFRILDEKIVVIEHEIAAMREQMSRIEQLRPHLDRLEATLNALKKEGTNAAAPAAAPTTETPAHIEPAAGG